MFDALSGPRRRLMIGLVAATVVGLVAIGVVTFANRSQNVDPVAQDTLGPVLLVPGYGGGTDALDVLAAALTRSGRDATVVQLAGDGTGDLRKQAKVVDTAVTAALERTGAASVDVVGYSAGGVTVRVWLDEFGTGGLVRRVVTLGSPHHGTSLAALAADLAPDSCPVGCRQLATDSDLLRSLNAKDETPSGPTWVSMWSENDRTVVPPESASIEGALDFSIQSVCPDEDIAHRDLPRNPTVIAMTIEALGPQLPVLPTATTCQR